MQLTKVPLDLKWHPGKARVPFFYLRATGAGPFCLGIFGREIKLVAYAPNDHDQ